MLIIGDELENAKVGQIGKLKGISGGSLIFVQNKHMPGFGTKYDGLVILIGNAMFKYGKDDAATDRLVIRKTTKPPKVMNDNLVNDIIDSEGDYLVYMLAQETKKMLDRPVRKRFTIPQSSLGSREEHRTDIDSVRCCLRDCFIIREDWKNGYWKEVPKAMIWDIYKGYCMDQNRGHFENKADFHASLEKIPVVVDGKIISRKDGTPAMMGDYGQRTAKRIDYYTHFYINCEAYEKYHPQGRAEAARNMEKEFREREINQNPPRALQNCVPRVINAMNTENGV